MIKYMLTAYCSVCGADFAESDDENLDDLSDGMRTRAELLYASHVTESQCEI